MDCLFYLSYEDLSKYFKEATARVRQFKEFVLFSNPFSRVL